MVYDSANLALAEDVAVLDDLVQTIEMLKARIKKHGDHISPYEKRTRVALIDPLLCALGWDVSDPDFVEIETRTANSWADYALLDSNRKPNVFVEAKKLADRDAPITQTVGYAVSENITHGANVRYCASTNGDVWEVYDITAQRSVMKVSIAQDDSAACALKLLGLWRRSLRDNGFNTAVGPLVDVDPPPPPPPPPFEWTPLMANFEPTGNPAPTAIKLPGGEERPTAYWVSVVKETALWLHRTRVLTRENCQVAIGPKRYLMSLDNKHQNEQPFSSPIPLGDTGITLEGNFSARDIVRHTKDLLEHFGKDPSQVYLKLE